MFKLSLKSKMSTTSMSWIDTEQMRGPCGASYLGSRAKSLTMKRLQKKNYLECGSKAVPLFLWLKHVTATQASYNNRTPTQPFLASAFWFILHDILVLTLAVSISFLPLSTRLAATITQPDAEKLHVYLIISWPSDLHLKAATEADITIWFTCFCVWAAVSQKIMRVSSRKRWRKPP